MSISCILIYISSIQELDYVAVLYFPVIIFRILCLSIFFKQYYFNPFQVGNIYNKKLHRVIIYWLTTSF